MRSKHLICSPTASKKPATTGPKVHLTPGSIRVAVDRLLEKGLVSRTESPDDRRVRIVALTESGTDLIVPSFRTHSAEIGRVFAAANPKELEMRC